MRLGLWWMRVCEQLVNRMGCGDLSRTALLLCDSDLAAVALARSQWGKLAALIFTAPASSRDQYNVRLITWLAL